MSDKFNIVVVGATGNVGREILQILEKREKSFKQKISQMKENALRDIKNKSVKISIATIENIFNIP